MITRTVICADEGKILTNGEIYGNHIFLAEGASKSDFYEITEKGYNKIMEENLIKE